jgi:hypothetical protein
VGNAATNWETDISRSFPEVMYNFNLIPKSLLDTYNDNDCVNYFNDLKPPSPSKVCEDAWNEINDLWDGLNWYDLFRQVVPDSGLLKQSASKAERTRTVKVGDEIKTYTAGYTYEEYAPWIAKGVPKRVL